MHGLGPDGCCVVRGIGDFGWANTALYAQQLCSMLDAISVCERLWGRALLHLSLPLTVGVIAGMGVGDTHTQGDAFF